MRKKLGSLTVAALAALPLASQAGAPTLSQVLDASGITERGYADAGYSATNFGTPNANSFTLSQVALTLAKQPTEGFGGLVNISLGNDAKFINAAYDTTASNFALTQAYVQYATGGLTVIAGRFVTLAGEEVIDQTQDANATRSLLFGIQTLVHTGVRATYKISDRLAVIGGVNNTAFGSDTAAGVDANPQKAIELGLTFAPASNLSMALSHYREASGAVTVGETDLTDFVANLQASQALALGFNADYKHTKSGTANGSVQKGAALYVGYQFCDPIKGTLRAEYLKGQGATDGIAKELTYTVDYTAAKNFNLLAEYRYDHATASASKTVGSTVSVKAIFAF